MIRFINCIKKRDEISQEEFRDWWNSGEFDALRERMATASGAIKSTKTCTLQVEANLIIQQERETGEIYDGVFEYFWNDASSFMDIYNDEKHQLLRKQMTRFLGQFVDLSKSTGFFTEY